MKNLISQENQRRPKLGAEGFSQAPTEKGKIRVLCSSRESKKAANGVQRKEMKAPANLEKRITPKHDRCLQGWTFQKVGKRKMETQKFPEEGRAKFLLTAQMTVRCLLRHA